MPSVPETPALEVRKNAVVKADLCAADESTPAIYPGTKTTKWILDFER